MSPRADYSDRLALGSSVGRYVVIGHLGDRVWGQAYDAYDPELDRRVVLELADEAHAELIGNARALARISHAHVARVHDSGTHEGRPYVAVEHIDGSSARDWLKRDKPDWRQVHQVFLGAARGLATVHDAGVVLGAPGLDAIVVGRDGIARLRLEPEAGNDSADRESDLTALCAAMHEAVFGRAPSDEEASGELSRSGEHSAPAWLRRVIRRGLGSRSPERFASAASLVDALDYDPGAGRRRALVAVGLGAIAAIGFAGYQLMAKRASLACKGSERKLAGVWDGQAHDTVETVFAATGLPFAADSYRGAEAALDRYAAAWSRMHSETCEATRVHRQQSETVLDLRMQCLDRRLEEMRALTSLLTRADATIVREAVSASHSLTELTRCADVEALQSRVARLPRETQFTVNRLDTRLAEAKALHEAGKYNEGLAVAAAVVEATRPLQAPQFLARALLELGELQERAGQATTAETTLREAVRVAWGSGEDEVAARAWIALADVAATELGSPDVGLRHCEHASAAIERIDGDTSLRSSMHYVMAVALQEAARYEEALTHSRVTLELREGMWEPSHPQVAAAAIRLGDSLNALGRHAEALKMYERAQQSWDEAVGSKHPSQAALAGDMARVLYQQGKLDLAWQHAKRANDIFVELYGPKHPAVARTLGGVGIIALARGHTADAIQYQQKALATWEALGTPDSSELGATLNNLAASLRAENREDEALTIFERALELALESVGPDHPQVAAAYHNVADVLHLRGDNEASIPYFYRSARVFEISLGLTHPSVARALLGAGICELALGRPNRALVPLERAVAIGDRGDTDPFWVGNARFSLAQALWSTPQTRKRAIALARLARETYVSSQSPSEAAIATLDTWMRERGLRPGG